jgi:signal transduction histidine kinase
MCLDGFLPGGSKMPLKLPSKRELLPTLAFGVPLIAIAFVQYRWLHELQNRAEMLERQQNREAAQHAVSVMTEEMSSARLTVLPPVGHADLVAHKFDTIAHLFDKGHERFGYVDRFFVWTASMPRGEALFYSRKSGQFLPDPSRLAHLPMDVWALGEDLGRWGELLCSGAEPACQLVIHRIVNDEEASLLAIAGFTVDLRAFATDFAPEFATRALGPAVRDFLEGRQARVTLLDDSGGLLFGEGDDSAADGSASSVEFPLTFTLPSEGVRQTQIAHWRMLVGDAGAGGVLAALRRGVFGNIAIVGAGLIVLAIGSALMARSYAREAKLSDLKSRFISGISHELKTPLSNIRLYSEMLELGRVPNTAERRLFYRSLRQQAEILGMMLEDILDFSRLEAEQNVSRFEPCDLREILQEAVDMRDWHSAAHAVDIQVPAPLPAIRGNHSALVRVVHSLLDNASKYSGAEEHITVTADRQNGMVRIEVADRGVGIPPEDIPHLFERFYRGRTSSDVKGTGLGLSIAQSLVASHGGSIEVESELGKGSRFTVLLPVESKES